MDIDLHFLALLSAVVFAGCVGCPRSRVRGVFGDMTREDLAARLYNKAVAVIQMTNFPESPSMPSLTAYVIVNTTWLRSEQPLACLSFIGVAIRVAQMLGQ